MNLNTPMSAITCPSSKFIFGKAMSNRSELLSMDACELVKSLFGVASNEPSAIDITEAIVKMLSVDEQTQIRKLLFDRGVCGVIWCFTTPQKFMIEMSKIPKGFRHDISLSLVMRNPSNPEEMITRLLVVYGNTKVEFHNTKEHLITLANPSIAELDRIHDEAMKQLEKKYLEPGNSAPKVVEFKLEGNKVVNISVEGDKLLFKNVLTGVKLFSLEGKEYVENITSRGNCIIFKSVAFLYNKDENQTIIAKINEALEVPTEPAEPEEKQEIAEATVVDAGTEQERVEVPENRLLASKDDIIIVNRGGSESEIKIVNVTATKAGMVGCEYIGTLDCDVEELVDCGYEYVCEDELREDTLKDPVKLREFLDVKLHDNEPPQEETPPEPCEDKQILVCTAGEEVHVKTIHDNAVTLQLAFPNGERALIVEQEEIKDVDPFNVLDGTYRAIVNIYEGDLKGSLVDLFSHLEFIARDTKDEDEEQKPEEPQPQEQEIKPMKYNIEVEDEELDNVADEIKSLITQMLDSDPGMSCDEISAKLQEETDIDDLHVRYNSDTFEYRVFIVPPPCPQDEPEHKTVAQKQSIDITNIKNQLAMLSGLFGVAAPAITHVEKFLRNHLTEEGNVGFLKTGTFPTEVTISYMEKPYDITYAIVKFKDGRFYRVLAAITNPGLSDQSYLATSQEPGRWVKLIDVQNTAFKQDVRGRRY